MVPQICKPFFPITHVDFSAQFSELFMHVSEEPAMLNRNSCLVFFSLPPMSLADSEAAFEQHSKKIDA